MQIPFAKMDGTGNDFILIDNRRSLVEESRMREFTRHVCRRAQSVGADGVIFVVDHPGLDFAWRFFNADGSEAEMCGNGARCVARFAHKNGIAGKAMQFQTIAGVIEAQIVDDRRVKVRLTRAAGYQPISLTTEFGQEEGCFINTGVPHVVIPVSHVGEVNVFDRGRAIRHHEVLAPAGSNANFVEVAGPNSLIIRTYERGVEGETLACGTGCVATAAVMVKNGSVKAPVELTVRSGEVLKVHFSGDDPLDADAWLEGPTQWVFDGVLTPEAF